MEKKNPSYGGIQSFYQILQLKTQKIKKKNQNQKNPSLKSKLYELDIL